MNQTYKRSRSQSQLQSYEEEYEESFDPRPSDHMNTKRTHRRPQQEHYSNHRVVSNSANHQYKVEDDGRGGLVYTNVSGNLEQQHLVPTDSHEYDDDDDEYDDDGYDDDEYDENNPSKLYSATIQDEDIVFSFNDDYGNGDGRRRRYYESHHDPVIHDQTQMLYYDEEIDEDDENASFDIVHEPHHSSSREQHRVAPNHYNGNYAENYETYPPDQHHDAEYYHHRDRRERHSNHISNDPYYGGGPNHHRHDKQVSFDLSTKYYPVHEQIHNNAVNGHVEYLSSQDQRPRRAVGDYERHTARQHERRKHPATFATNYRTASSGRQHVSEYDRKPSYTPPVSKHNSGGTYSTRPSSNFEQNYGNGYLQQQSQQQQHSSNNQREPNRSPPQLSIHRKQSSNVPEDSRVSNHTANNADVQAPPPPHQLIETHDMKRSYSKQSSATHSSTYSYSNTGTLNQKTLSELYSTDEDADNGNGMVIQFQRGAVDSVDADLAFDDSDFSLSRGKGGARGFRKGKGNVCQRKCHCISLSLLLLLVLAIPFVLTYYFWYVPQSNKNGHNEFNMPIESIPEFPLEVDDYLNLLRDQNNTTDDNLEGMNNNDDTMMKLLSVDEEDETPVIDDFFNAPIRQRLPSFFPSVKPTLMPSVNPTQFPSVLSSILPTLMPSTNPTIHISAFPSSHPTFLPTFSPSLFPTSHPSTLVPSSHPTTPIPSSLPTNSPSIRPSFYPSNRPSNSPSLSPSFYPTTSFPSKQPSSLPTIAISVPPSTFFPTSRPSFAPTRTPQWVKISPNLHTIIDIRGLYGLSTSLSSDGNRLAILHLNGVSVYEWTPPRRKDDIWEWTKVGFDVFPTWLLSDTGRSWESIVLNNELVSSSITLSTDGMAFAWDIALSDIGRIGIFSYLNNELWALQGQVGGYEESPGGSAFGTSVAYAKGNMNRVLVGAWNGESARVYENNGAVWRVVGNHMEGFAPSVIATFISNNEGPLYGASVAFSNDGLIAAVAAPHDGVQDRGTVKVYKLNQVTATWDQIGQTIKGPQNSNFGILSMSGNGSRIAVGMPKVSKVHIYEFSKSLLDWMLLGTMSGLILTEKFGQMVTLSEDGNVIAIVAAATGRICTYRYDAALQLWVRVSLCIQVGDVGDQYLRFSVSLSSAGERLVIGAPGLGVMVFELGQLPKE